MKSEVRQPAKQKVAHDNGQGDGRFPAHQRPLLSAGDLVSMDAGSGGDDDGGLAVDGIRSALWVRGRNRPARDRPPVPGSRVGDLIDIGVDGKYDSGWHAKANGAEKYSEHPSVSTVAPM